MLSLSYILNILILILTQVTRVGHKKLSLFILYLQMTDKNRFKKLPSIANLNIPKPDDVPFSPGYKRLNISFVKLKNQVSLLSKAKSLKS